MMAILFKDAAGLSGGEVAMKVVDTCVRQGVMLYAPVGPGGATVKINPPLMITEDALIEGLGVFAEAVECL
jgi:4-aminobutyrate aminotransferase-like enzyme